MRCTHQDRVAPGVYGIFVDIRHGCAAVASWSFRLFIATDVKWCGRTLRRMSAAIDCIAPNGRWFQWRRQLLQLKIVPFALAARRFNCDLWLIVDGWHTIVGMLSVSITRQFRRQHHRCPSNALVACAALRLMIWYENDMDRRNLLHCWPSRDRRVGLTCPFDGAASSTLLDARLQCHTI